MDKETFKKTLEEALDILSSVKRLEKTSSVSLIASALHVKSRQVFRWLGDDANAPHDLDTKYQALQQLIVDCKNEGIGTSNHFPVPTKPIGMIPFQMKIVRDSINVSQDKDGSILINGMFSLNLTEAKK